MTQQKQGPRELIELHKEDKRYIRRDSQRRFTSDQVGMGRSLSRDRHHIAKRVAKEGYEYQGDRRR